jgi:glycosyltransferase involved in cell wall biosynthesis
VIVTRNLEPIYDIGTAIRAFALAKRRLGALRLSIAGTGPELEALQRLADELGIAPAVQFTAGWTARRSAQLHRSADLMLNPSRADNAPVSILEAFASGVPVVSTNVGGIPHVAEHMRTAWLVPPGDPAAMADAIVAVLSDHGLARSLAEAAAATPRATPGRACAPAGGVRQAQPRARAAAKGSCTVRMRLRPGPIPATPTSCAI